jgi:hypothetical protein
MHPIQPIEETLIERDSPKYRGLFANLFLLLLNILYPLLSGDPCTRGEDHLIHVSPQMCEHKWKTIFVITIEFAG